MGRYTVGVAGPPVKRLSFGSRSSTLLRPTNKRFSFWYRFILINHMKTNKWIVSKAAKSGDCKSPPSGSQVRVLSGPQNKRDDNSSGSEAATRK